MIYLSKEPNTGVRVKEEAAWGSRGPAVRELEEDGGRQLPHKLWSITYIKSAIKGSTAPAHEWQCQTASHQRLNDLMWVHGWQPNQGGEDKRGCQGHSRVEVEDLKLEN